MHKILTVIGARPQFIKASPVSRAIARHSAVKEVVVPTGQHYDANMSDVFFDELQMDRPKHYLDISGGTHGQMTGRMLERLEQTMLAERPDAVLVYGDTNSTLAGGLAAAKLNVPLAHVEAGLRSRNRAMPEEINRILTDHASDILFTPTLTASENLLAEGIPKSRIHEVGDVMLDASRIFGELAAQNPEHLQRSGVESGKFVLATVHRQENTDDPDRLTAIFNGLGKVTHDLPVVLPLHPRTRSRLEAADLMPLLEPITVVEPMGYLAMVAHQRAAAVIATDSGGVQKEAFFSGVPCVTLRDETEWVELLDTGWNTLTPPTSGDAVAQSITAAIGTTGEEASPYGDGKTAQSIVDGVVRLLSS